MMNSWTTESVEETKRLAAALAKCLHAGDVVVLNGDLGAGKTHFVQGAVEALGITQPVTSPTFNILQTYPIPPKTGDGGLSYGQGEESVPVAINHFDLYRLEAPEELDDIGYWETLEGEGASFIEWGDRFPEDMPSDYLEVRISSNDQGERTIQAESHGPRSETLLSAWVSCVEEPAV